MGIRLFVNEDGYTSVAVATALLVSVCLVLCVASVEWTVSKAADVQDVADAVALAGSGVVARYCTLAQVLDACVLSLGLAGMTLMGAGLVLAAVPGGQAASDAALDEGLRVLRERNQFARKVCEGLSRLEGLLPALVVLGSARCANANDAGGLDYQGLAIPFPLQSSSDFVGLLDEVEADGLREDAQSLQDEAREAEDAKLRANEARERAWRADCVDDPRCLQSRAQSLAGLPDVANPRASSPEEWSFGMAIERSRTYYARRLAQETAEGTDIESVTDSLARRAYYGYALDEVNGAWYREDADGTVSLHVPHLAKSTQEVRGTRLYTDAVWPCTKEEGGRTLHSTLECPGAQGPAAGADSVSAVDEGRALLCGTCGMDASDLGSVAAISTIATNGYEHYWQIVADCAEAYQTARNEQAETQRRMKDTADEAGKAFEEALGQLRVPRPDLRPPGMLGCVSIVWRRGGAAVPSELTAAFLEGRDLPAGMAVSASALAPDDATDGNDVLSRFFGSLCTRRQGPVSSTFGKAFDLWGRLLVSYGKAYAGMGEAVDGFLQGCDGVFGSSVGGWLQRRIAQGMSMLGLEPADMRVRRPVLTGTQDVLEAAGLERNGLLRSIVAAWPQGGSAKEVARFLGVWLAGGSGDLVSFDMPVPGSSEPIPFTVDLGLLEGDL